VNINCLLFLLQETWWAFKQIGFFFFFEIKIDTVGADENNITKGA
jgi:hypothetical protein